MDNNLIFELVFKSTPDVKAKISIFFNEVAFFLTGRLFFSGSIISRSEFKIQTTPLKLIFRHDRYIFVLKGQITTSQFFLKLHPKTGGNRDWRLKPSKWRGSILNAALPQPLDQCECILKQNCLISVLLHTLKPRICKCYPSEAEVIFL